MPDLRKYHQKSRSVEIYREKVRAEVVNSMKRLGNVGLKNHREYVHHITS